MGIYFGIDLVKKGKKQWIIVRRGGWRKIPTTI